MGRLEMGFGIPICHSLRSQDSMKTIMVGEGSSRQVDQMGSLSSTLEWILKNSFNRVHIIGSDFSSLGMEWGRETNFQMSVVFLR